MTHFRLSIILLFILTASMSALTDKQINEKAKELLSKMTLTEKIMQLGTENANAIPRLKIPQYRWHNECLHGLVSDNITVFPSSISLAATFDTDLISQVACAISDEARIQFKHGQMGLTYWSPNLDLARDPRWGRTSETYGEDPYLAGQCGTAYVKAMQGNDPVYFKTILSPKHYTIHSGPETERHWLNPKTSQKDFWETYMKPFETIVREGGVYSMMCAYNAYSGVPISVNNFLIEDVLRNKWGLKGFVMSDCGALSNVVWSHWYAKNEVEAVALSIRAGVDLDCGDFFIKNAEKAIKQDLLTEADIDKAVLRLLVARLKLGVIEPPPDFPYNNIPDSLLASYKHRQLALKAAQESIVLLKNKNNTLPLNKNLQSIYVIGPNAPTYCEMLGGYHGWPKYWVSFLDGLKKKIKPECKLTFNKGCEIVGSFTELIPVKYLKTINGERGLTGEYFSNKNLEGKPVLTRVDTVINFNWQRKSPVGEKDGEPFSVRWTGILTVPQTAEYTFKTINNDGTRLFIDDKKILDNWWDHGASPFIGFDSLIAGKEYKIVLEYYFNQSFASVRLECGNENTGQDFIDSITSEASNYDAIVFVGGISTMYESEELGDVYAPGFYGGDKTSIDLPPTQTKILKALKKSGKPIVLVMMSGSCLAINWENDNIPAIVQTWYAGQEAGDAIADVLFGDYNPSGRTPLTWYKSLDDVPDFKNYYMTNRTYRFLKKEPLYPFGFGLSYTSFEYENLILPKETIMVENVDSVAVTFNLKNSGKLSGDEVVQIYVVNKESKFEKANKSLIAFKRVNLRSGEKSTIHIKIPLKEFSIYDSTKHRFIIETGKYEIQVATSSKDVKLSGEINLKSSDTNINTDLDKMTLLYPNPTNRKFSLKINQILNSNNITIKVFSITGKQERITISRDYSNNLFKIDCKHLTPGFYILQLISGTYRTTKKFVINR